MILSPQTGLLMAALAATFCSCVSRQTIAGSEWSILGEWIVPGGQPPMARTMVSDTINWKELGAQVAMDAIKTTSNDDQMVRFRAGGIGEVRDKGRGRVRFEYAFSCDSTKAFLQMGDSAGYFVELVGQPLIPCELRIGDATYVILCEPRTPFADSTQVSRQIRSGAMVVSESYVMMIRKGR